MHSVVLMWLSEDTLKGSVLTFHVEYQGSRIIKKRQGPLPMSHVSDTLLFMFEIGSCCVALAVLAFIDFKLMVMQLPQPHEC